MDWKITWVVDWTFCIGMLSSLVRLFKQSIILEMFFQPLLRHEILGKVVDPSRSHSTRMTETIVKSFQEKREQWRIKKEGWMVCSVVCHWIKWSENTFVTGISWAVKSDCDQDSSIHWMSGLSQTSVRLRHTNSEKLAYPNELTKHARLLLCCLGHFLRPWGSSWHFQLWQWCWSTLDDMFRPTRESQLINLQALCDRSRVDSDKNVIDKAIFWLEMSKCEEELPKFLIVSASLFPSLIHLEFVQFWDRESFGCWERGVF